MSKITGYRLPGSNGIGLTMLPSMRAPSDVVNVKISAGEYACVASQVVVAALLSIVRNFRPAAVQSSTCVGCFSDEYRSMKYVAFGDMLIRWVPSAVVVRCLPVPSNRTEYNWRLSGDASVDV